MTSRSATISIGMRSMLNRTTAKAAVRVQSNLRCHYCAIKSVLAPSSSQEKYYRDEYEHSEQPAGPQEPPTAIEGTADDA